MARTQQIPVKFFKTRDIDEHVKLIARQVTKSLEDPETRQLAVKIVSNKVEWRRVGGSTKEAPFVQAWGRWYKMPLVEQCPPRSDECEVVSIWNFLVLNCRYVYDIQNVDTFATLKYTLEAGGGDCDDSCIAFAALLRSVGFSVQARVIATSEDPNSWAHVYPRVGLSKDNASKWVCLDMTVTDATPGWEYNDIAAYRDYQL